MRKEIPTVFERFPEEKMLDSLIRKFRKGQIHAAREFRILKKVLTGVKKKIIPKKRAIDLLSKLVEDPETDIEQISRVLMLETPNIEELTQACKALANSLSAIPHAKTAEERKLKEAILTLKQQVDRLVLGKRTKE